MKYFYIEPEVAGGFGNKTILDSSVHPPVVTKLNYQFDGWLGDVIVETFPCVIATMEATNLLKKAAVTGVDYADVDISTSQEYDDLHPNRPLPEFKWLKVHGAVGESDFGVAKDFRFVISQKVIDILHPLGISNALIEEFKKE